MPVVIVAGTGCGIVVVAVAGETSGAMVAAAAEAAAAGLGGLGGELIQCAALDALEQQPGRRKGAEHPLTETY
jgi:hypothetical protein